MRREWIWKSLFLTCVSFLYPVDGKASHLQEKTHDYELLAKGSKERIKHGHWDHVLSHCIEKGNWRVLGYMSKMALEKKTSLAKLKEIAEHHDCIPMRRAVKAVRLLHRISKGLKLSLSDLFEIALFIETSLAKEVEAHGTYLSHSRTGLAKTIEFDPKTGYTFIHLGENKESKIGSGRKKIVTKSLKYHTRRPEVVAHCVTESPMPAEILALKEVHSLPGVMKMITHTERKNSRGKTIYSIICKYYRGGTFAQKVKEKGKIFSLKQKMQLAIDILTGLSSMHTKGFVHRDINLRNCFFHVTKKGKREKYKGIVADMGRAVPAAEAAGIPAQGNPYYIAPEGITFNRMKHNDYVYTDIYAMGCVLYQLFYKSRGPWALKSIIRDCTLPAEARKTRFVWKLSNYRRERFRQLLKRGSYRFNQSPKERIERLILKMVDPRPENRGNTEELKETMQYILQDYIKSKKR